MSLVTLGGNRVHAATVSMPVRGAWHADVDVDADLLVEGERLTLTAPGLTLTGTARRAGIYSLRGGVRLYAGADGLRTEIRAVSYRRVYVRQVLADLARETGETISATADTAVLGTFLERFTRPRGSAADALAALLDLVPGATWRSLDDGSIWVGSNTWPTSDLLHQVIDDDIKDFTATIASETAALRPGVILDGRRVTRVEHSFEAGAVRTSLEYTRDIDESDTARLLAAFTTLVRRITRGVKFHARRVGTILSQEVSGRVAVKLDGAELAGAEGVLLRYGLPGFRAKVPAGTRCVVEYEEGDGRKPVVTSFEGEAVTEVAFDGGTKAVARVDDTTSNGHLVIVGSPVTAITYFPPGTLPDPAPPGTVIALSGVVTSGNTKLKA